MDSSNKRAAVYPLYHWPEKEIDQLVMMVRKVRDMALKWHLERADQEEMAAGMQEAPLMQHNPPPVQEILTHLKSAVAWGSFPRVARARIRKVLAKDPIGQIVLLVAYSHGNEHPACKSLHAKSPHIEILAGGILEMYMRENDLDSAARIISLLEGEGHPIENVQTAGLGIMLGDKTLLSYQQREDAERGKKTKQGASKGGIARREGQKEKDESDLKLLATELLSGMGSVSADRFAARLYSLALQRGVPAVKPSSLRRRPWLKEQVVAHKGKFTQS